MKKTDSKKIIIAITLILVAIIVWYLVYTLIYRESVRARTHERVSTYINEDLQYNES